VTSGSRPVGELTSLPSWIKGKDEGGRGNAGRAGKVRRGKKRDEKRGRNGDFLHYF